MLENFVIHMSQPIKMSRQQGDARSESEVSKRLSDINLYLDADSESFSNGGMTIGQLLYNGLSNLINNLSTKLRPTAEKSANVAGNLNGLNNQNVPSSANVAGYPSRQGTTNNFAQELSNGLYDFTYSIWEEDEDENDEEEDYDWSSSKHMLI